MNKNILKKALTENGVCMCLATCESTLQTVNHAKELSLTTSVIFLTFLTVTYFAVTDYLTRSSLREQSFPLAFSLRGYNPSW